MNDGKAIVVLHYHEDEPENIGPFENHAAALDFCNKEIIIDDMHDSFTGWEIIVLIEPKKWVMS